MNDRYSLQDRRMAKQHIKVSPSLPAGAVAMGEYSAQRCHQYAQNEAPSDEILIDDLILLAYAEGADGITGLRFSRESGLLKNCWHIAKGYATLYKK